MSRDDFYIGWQDSAAPALNAWLRRAAVGLVLGVVLLAAGISSRQAALPSGRFEFGVARSFTGVLHEEPLARLRLQEPTAGLSASTQVLLVGFGKRGLPDWARGHHGRLVRFRGSLIHRENLVMIEMNEPDSFELLGDPEPGDATGGHLSLGELTLTGELVDTKCYLGVMRPATGKVHRACAVRCLAGGVPPGLLVRHGGGEATVFLLAGADGGPLELDPQLAARTLEVRGETRVLEELPIVFVEEWHLKGAPD